MAMTHQEALEILHRHRRERIVITTMTSVGVQPSISDTPLDFAYIPSAMGHGPSLGLGLALAQPERGVIVLNGDGCMLMSLGSLVTLGQSGANMILIVMDNGLYEVTGGQKVAGAGKVDYVKLAEASGIERVFAFENAEDWASGAESALAGRGPTLIWLKLEGRLGQKTPKPPHPMEEQIRRLREALGAS